MIAIMKKIIFAVLAGCMACIGCNGDKGGNEPLSLTVAAPSDITVERTGPIEVKVVWRDNSSNETGFSIWVREAADAANRKIAGTAGANATEYTIADGLTEGNNYFFGVQANGATEEQSSQVVYTKAPYRITPSAELPAATIVGEPVATQTCIALSYKIANNAAGDKYGLCWSAEGIPTIDGTVQHGPALPTDGSAVLQAIPNALLEYGKTYKIRAFVTTPAGTFYSAEKSASLEAAPAEIKLTWTRITDSSLPSGVELYSTSGTLNGRKFDAWYAVADVSGEVELRVNVPSGTKTLEAQFADANGDCHVLINGGFFYNTSHTGLAVVNGETLPGTVWAVRGSLNQTAEPVEYAKMYYVTRGVFGVTASGQPGVCWTGTSETDKKAYYFDRPLPTVKGEAQYKTVNGTNPADAIAWAPRYALSAGPVLVCDGKIPFDFTLTSKGDNHYLTNYEVIPYDIFGTGVIPDRTAIGYLEDGRVVLFVCDGRISGGSQGASLTELAAIMKGLGCVGAVNLDGGGSTGIVVGGEYLNDQAHGKRAVVSTVGFYKKK